MAAAHGVAESRQQALINSISIPPAFVGQPVLLKMLTAFKKNPCQSRESDMDLPWF
jgi:hypothetical protein